MEYDDVLADMVAVAREAGALTLGYFRRFRELEIGIKGPADFVSEADRELELLIRERLVGALSGLELYRRGVSGGGAGGSASTAGWSIRSTGRRTS